MSELCINCGEREPFGDYCTECIAAGVPNREQPDVPAAAERTITRLSDFVAKVEALDTLDAIAAFFRDVASPPADAMDRALLREKLLPVLKDRGASAPAKILDPWFKSAQVESPGQGTALTFADIEPWPDRVDGAELLDEIKECLARFVVADEHNLVAAALWSLYTHCYDLFDISPILCITSPTKRCGKSLLLRLVQRLCSRPLMSSNVTAAALFRAIEAHAPTLFVDEADTFTHLSDELRGILNAGHARDTARVIRAVGEEFEPRVFSTWAPKAMTAIGSLPDTIEDRAIRLRMARKQSTEPRTKAVNRVLGAATAPLVRKCRTWAQDHQLELRDAELPSIEGLDDRAEDNWGPLIVIADIAGGDWPMRARAAALGLAGGDPEEGADYVRLFAGIAEAFGEQKSLGTIDLVKALGGQEDGPRAEWWGRDLAEAAGYPEKADAIFKKLGARLKRDLEPFGIRPKQLWLDGKKVRGYEREQFLGVWETYGSVPRKDGRHGRNGRAQVDDGAPDQGPTVPTVPTVPAEATAKLAFAPEGLELSRAVAETESRLSEGGLLRALAEKGLAATVPELGRLLEVPWAWIRDLLGKLEEAGAVRRYELEGAEVWELLSGEVES